MRDYLSTPCPMTAEPMSRMICPMDSITLELSSVGKGSDLVISVGSDGVVGLVVAQPIMTKKARMTKARFMGHSSVNGELPV